MARYRVKNMRFSACAVTVGEVEKKLVQEPALYRHDQELFERLHNIIGMDTRFTALPETTTADLCADAATRLLRETGLNAGDVSMIISITQTPDYPMPGNAHVLHARLGLDKECPAVDVQLGCSGFVYGLWLAGLSLSEETPRILVCAGDTLSRMAHPQDRAVYPLFGDAACAALVEYAPAEEPAFFILRSSGAGLRSMYVPAGGSRTPAGADTAALMPLDDGGATTAGHIHMDGMGIFKFTMTEQPQLLRDILDYSGKNPEDMDYFFLHQANKYIVECIAKKSEIPQAKAPARLFSRFGNQNSCSIPGAICATLAETPLKTPLQVVMQGYGIGLSWAACQMRLNSPAILPVARYGS